MEEDLEKARTLAEKLNQLNIERRVLDKETTQEAISQIKKHKNEDILLFGFTYIIWEHFFKPLRESEQTFALENVTLLHGGGWKKLFDEEVDNREFRKSLENVCGIQKVYNYYGMVEQTGSIFIECESGFLHCYIFSAIIVRRTDFT